MIEQKNKSKLDNFLFGFLSGLILAVGVTSLIIYVNSNNLTVLEYYSHLFDRNKVGYIIKSSVLMSLKGGAIAVMPLFYLFLNKRMMNAVKGLVTVVAIIGLFIVWGIFF